MFGIFFFFKDIARFYFLFATFLLSSFKFPKYLPPFAADGLLSQAGLCRSTILSLSSGFSPPTKPAVFTA
jgi:hypothetical protein